MLYPRAQINPGVLTFAREKMGYAISEIADKVNVKEERWVEWEKGERKPTSRQLIQVAQQLDRTPGFFYLKQPPEERETLSEFRTIKNVPLTSKNPGLIQTIREAKRNRENLLALYEQQGKVPSEVPKLRNKQEYIVENGKFVRDRLGVTYEAQQSWSQPSTALTQWRELLENVDIYVVQFPFVEVEQARGFAWAEEPLPIIGLNSQDSYNARIFTLIHELAHVLFRDSILVNDRLTNYWESRNQEQLCNELAAEILVPTQEISSAFNTGNRNIFEEIKKMGRLFSVSDYVILIRLKKLSLISEEQFLDLLPSISLYSNPQKSKGGNPYRNQIVRKGKLFIKNAFQSYFEDRITIAELANLTEWKVPNLNKLAAETFGWPEEGSYV